MFVLIFLGKDLKLTNCLYVNITKTGMHFPQKTKFMLLRQTGYLYLQNRCKTSCSKNGARLLFNVVSKDCKEPAHVKILQGVIEL